MTRRSSPPPDPRDGASQLFPVSIKGVIPIGRKFVLLKNERNEWELPGGKLELGESPVECLRREIKEELQLLVTVGRLLDVWVYDILGKVNVLIITFACRVEGTDAIAISAEHKAV